MRWDSPSLKLNPTTLRIWSTAAKCVAIAGVAFLAGFCLRGREKMQPHQAEETSLQAEAMPPQENIYIPQPAKIYPQAGIECSAPWSSTCFDRRRCVGVDGSPRLSIYAHDFNCTNAPSTEILARKKPIGDYRTVPNAALKSFRKLARQSGLLAERVEDACIIVYALTSTSWCITKTSEWNGGRNHLLVDWDDQAREYYYPDFQYSTAMWAQANMQARYFRFGYDIALPFPPKIQLDYLADIPPTKRSFFATFKGQLYLSRSGKEEREAIHHLGASADSPDVIVVEHCQTLHNEHLLPENLELCQKLGEESGNQDYRDLMNTTFALIPAGRSPATYRLSEAMSAGAIPVFFHNSFVKPFPDLIPWRLCSFSFSIEEAPVVIDTLRAVPKKKLAFMQRVVLQVYRRHFKHDVEGIVRTTLETLENRLAFQSERVR